MDELIIKTKNKVNSLNEATFKLEKYKEFMPIFERIMNAVARIEKTTTDAIARIERKYDALADSIKNDAGVTLTSMRKQMSEGFMGEDFKRLKVDIKNLEKRIDERLSTLKDGMPGPKGDMGMPGRNVDENKIISIISAQVKNIFADQDKRLSKALSNVSRGKQQLGMRKVPIIRAIDLTSQIDGIVTTYNLPRDTVRVLFVWSTQFPIILQPTTDFSLNGNTLTLESPVGVIQSGQTLTALVETLFYA